MAATVTILSYHGAGGSESGGAVDGTTIRFKQADNDTVDTTANIPIPAAGTNRSYVKNFRFNVSAWNSGTSTINNLKVSSPTSSLGTGVDIMYLLQAGYKDPTTTTTSDMDASANSILNTDGGPIAVTGSQANPTTGAFGQFIVYQMEVGSTATQGVTGNQSLKYVFDEF